jgi:hypothetical protein
MRQMAGRIGTDGLPSAPALQPLEHFSAKWIRFAVGKFGEPRREMIPRKWKQL